MAGILSQDEVDALLQAVEDGDVQISENQRQNQGDGALEVNEYSFRRPNLLTRDQQRMFSMLHDHFAAEAQSRLSLTLRSSSEVKLVASDQLQYSEFIMSLPDVTHLIVMPVETYSGYMVFEVGLPFIYTIIDVILGGDGIPPLEHRSLTDVESAIAKPILDQMVADLAVCLGHVTECKFGEGRSESSPQYVNAMPSDTPSMVMTFEAKVGKSSGVINVCYPIPMVERMLANAHGQAATATSFFSEPTAVDGSTTPAEEAIANVPLSLHAALGTARLRISDLLSLEVGDVLMTDATINSLLQLSAGGIAIYRARAGKRRRRLATKITGFIRPAAPDGKHPPAQGATHV